MSGFNTALENVTVGDISISDVVNLQTTLDGKQPKITDNNYISISDVSGLSAALESSSGGGSKINADTNITVVDIECDDITLSAGSKMLAPTIHATGSLLISKDIYNYQTINVLTDKQDTIYTTTDIVPRFVTYNKLIGRTSSTITGATITATSNLIVNGKNVITELNNKQTKITVNSYLSISDVSGLSTALENVTVGDINISNVINLQNTLDSKQTKITDNNYISISEVSGLSAALENVTVGDINISDVINLQTTLDDKQTKITDNSYLSITDVSGLSTALENVTVGDIIISDVINLQTRLDAKQDDITIYDNFIINSLYVAPFTTKTTINPTFNGELRASILSVEDDVLGVINVGNSISSLITQVSGKQDEINTTTALNMNSITATNQVSCGSLIVDGDNIQTIISNANGSSLTKSDIDGKQDKLEAGSNITIDPTTNIISATGGVSQSDLDLKQIILNDVLSEEIEAFKATFLNLYINNGIFYYNGLSLDALLTNKQNVFTRDFDSFNNRLDVYEANISGGTGSLSFGSTSLQLLLSQKHPLITSTSDLTMGNLTCTSVISNGVNINT